STCLRLKAKSWFVSPAARSPALWIASRPSRNGSRASTWSSAIRLYPLMMGQQVVEVVRHASGQSADTLQLLRLPELLFQQQSLCLRPLRTSQVRDEAYQRRPFGELH